MNKPGVLKPKKEAVGSVGKTDCSARVRTVFTSNVRPSLLNHYSIIPHLLLSSRPFEWL
jgi:hypothetical protein